MKKVLILITLINSCAPASNSSDNGSTVNAGNSSHVTVNKLATIDSNGSTVANIVQFAAGTVTAYIPSVDRYVSIQLADGQYSPSFFYWSHPNCTGVPIVSGFIGETGKSILFDLVNNKYFLVSNLIFPNTTMSYQSYSISGNCTNASYSTVSSYGFAALTEVSKPYDFTSMAPITIVFH